MPGPDSGVVVRLEIGTKKLDTLTFFRVQKRGTTLERNSDGVVTRVNILIPVLPFVDDWTVLTDGTLAIVRGQDYHVQFIASDHTATHSQKIPYEWQRLDDRVKSIWVDSMRAAYGRVEQQNGGRNHFVIQEASDLPDYRPAFGLGSVRADLQNRIWVRTTAPTGPAGGSIYDVIDRTGKRVDRVRVPANATIAGCGPGGAVYLGIRTGLELHLAKVVVP